jgi:hypothetical protein
MFNSNRQSVNVNRLALVEVLKANRITHVASYNEAVAGFQEKMIEVLKETLKKAKRGELKYLSVALQSPSSHEQEYTDAIEMLEVSVDDVINLDSDMFKAYYKDQWSWSRGFNELVGTYSKLGK